MNIRIIDNNYVQHAALLKKSIMERIPAEFGECGMTIELCVNKQLGTAESYFITSEAEGYRITGVDDAGLYYGIGKFLHTAKWSAEEFAPQPPEGVKSPACSFRAMYFAVHLFNWYANAPIEELERYLEELLLWGYNTIVLIIPVIDIESFEDRLYIEAVNKTKAIFGRAKKLGMKVGIIICPNQGMKSAPHEYDADPSFDPIGNVRGNAGRNICPSKLGAVEYLKNIWITMFQQYMDIGLDYIITWPYDEGGCGCEKCRPWGANAYCNLVVQLHEEAIRFYPNAKFIVSTWIFDKPDDQGEYEGLYKRLKGDLDWVDYIMVDAHADFPHYPLEHEIIKPIINFPEISMWKLYPWGGYGANPLPARFQSIWDSAKHILDGGMPYSEGMYEDISKIQYSGYYWEPNRDYRDILAEYINYECSWKVIDDALEMISCMEENHVRVGNNMEPDIACAIHGAKLAEKIHESLDVRGKKAWRWRLLYIRAILDKKRFEYYRDHNMCGTEDLENIRHFAGDFLEEDEEAQELFKELRRLYHSVEFNGTNQFTLPAVGGGTVFGFECARLKRK